MLFDTIRLAGRPTQKLTMRERNAMIESIDDVLLRIARGQAASSYAGGWITCGAGLWLYVQRRAEG